MDGKDGYSLAVLVVSPEGGPAPSRWLECVQETLEQFDPEGSAPDAQVFLLYGLELEKLDPKGSLKTNGYYFNIRSQPGRDRLLNLVRRVNPGLADSFRAWLRDHRGDTLALVYWMGWETADDMEREAERDYGRLTPTTGYR